MDKYEILTAMAKALDERDHLREVNDVLERDIHEYKVANGSGELAPIIAKLAEYGRSELFDKCYKQRWYQVGINELEGVLYPERTVAEWATDIFHATSVPEEFSAAEVHTLCERLVNEAYDKQFEQEKSEWLESHSDDEDDDE